MSTDELNIDREARRLERQKRRRKRILMRRIKWAVIFLLLLAVAAVVYFWLQSRQSEPEPVDEPTQPVVATVEPTLTPTPTPPPEPEEVFFTTENTAVISAALPSAYAVVIDAETGEILAQRDSDVPINPASMTKVLTLLVAAENIPDRTGTWTMTAEAQEYCFVNECSIVGYKVGETAPVEELFYGCIMNSGADACLGLAELAAGSHEAFVELMNEKLAELGISDTAHFTNCVGLYDENHYCTLEDLALILRTAWENEFCRQVLTCKTMFLSPTEQHPEEQAMSNWFIRRIEDQDTGSVTVLTGKTGWVEESGHCAVSYGEDENGHGYLCVTAKSTGTLQAVADQAELYRTYCN